MVEAASALGTSAITSALDHVSGRADDAVPSVLAVSAAASQRSAALDGVSGVGAACDADADPCGVDGGAIVALAPSSSAHAQTSAKPATVLSTPQAAIAAQ